MATGETIRAKVKGFLDRTGGELTRLEDAFAPWFLHSQYGLPEQEAVRQASDGSNDAGIDAFCVEHDRTSRPHLTIVQAKLTDSGPLVRKGIEDLRRGVETVHALLASGDTDLGLENRVIVNLRKQLAELTEEQRSELMVKCILVHLLPEQELWLLSPAVQKTVDEFKRAAGEGVQPYAPHERRRLRRLGGVGRRGRRRQRLARREAVAPWPLATTLV